MRIIQKRILRKLEKYQVLQTGRITGGLNRLLNQNMERNQNKKKLKLLTFTELNR